jgi:hypothetical protein
MGIDEDCVQFLAACKRDGVNFASTLTLGHQDLMISRSQAERLGLSSGMETDRYADGFLRSLGAERVEAVDASSFEGASIVHDLNEPIRRGEFGGYTAVIDAGTLEHIFNVPTALKSILSVVEVGGHFISISPTNNWAGHGFFQFSPELWFRVLSPQNGYRVKRMLLREVHPRGPWYEVTDPAEVGARAEFRSRHPTRLFICASREADAHVLQESPQQSDYAAQWAGVSSVCTMSWRLIRSRLAARARYEGRKQRSRFLRHLARREVLGPYVPNTVSMIPSHFRRIREP